MDVWRPDAGATGAVGYGPRRAVRPAGASSKTGKANRRPILSAMMQYTQVFEPWHIKSGLAIREWVERGWLIFVTKIQISDTFRPALALTREKAWACRTTDQDFLHCG